MTANNTKRKQYMTEIIVYRVAVVLQETTFLIFWRIDTCWKDILARNYILTEYEPHPDIGFVEAKIALRRPC